MEQNQNRKSLIKELIREIREIEPLLIIIIVLIINFLEVLICFWIIPSLIKKLLMPIMF